MRCSSPVRTVNHNFLHTQDWQLNIAFCLCTKLPTVSDTIKLLAFFICGQYISHHFQSFKLHRSLSASVMAADVHRTFIIKLRIYPCCSRMKHSQKEIVLPFLMLVVSRELYFFTINLRV